MSTSVDKRILVTQYEGALSRRAAIGAGVSASSLYRRTRSGFLIPVTDRAFVVAPLATDRSFLHAMQLAFPAGAVARSTAACFAGLPVKCDPYRFVVGHGERPFRRPADGRFPPMVVHETRDLPAEDVTTLQTLRLCSVPRALCDMAATHVSASFLRHNVEIALSKRLCTAADLLGCASERRRRGAAGMSDFSLLLADIVSDEPYPESRFEIELLAALRRVGLTDLRTQWKPPWYEGVRGVVDFAEPIGRSIIEADGRGHRQVTFAHDNDRSRDRIAVAHGFVVIRVGYHEFHRAPDRISGEIRDIVESRRNAALGSAA